MSHCDILFGSYARRDQSSSSDIDILGLVSSGRLEKNEVGSISYHQYPLIKAIREAQAGNLFFLHICREGRFLGGDKTHFDFLRQSFDYKVSYAREFTAGLLMAEFFFSLFEEFSEEFCELGSIQKKYIQKKSVWGIRTAVIAAAAQEKNPVFSAKKLLNYSKISGLDSLIKRRDKAVPNFPEKFLKLMVDFRKWASARSDLIKEPVEFAGLDLHHLTSTLRKVGLGDAAKSSLEGATRSLSSEYNVKAKIPKNKILRLAKGNRMASIKIFYE